MTEKPWWEILNVNRDWPLDAIRAIWHDRMTAARPDKAAVAAINAAFDQAQAEKKS